MGSFSMNNVLPSGSTDGSKDTPRVITCDLTFDVTEHTEIVVQIVAAESAGRVNDQRFGVTVAGSPPPSVVELSNSAGERMHVIRADPGRLSVSYRSQLQAAPPPPLKSPAAMRDVGEEGRTLAFERQIYLRPSRYVPSDHLIGFAVAEFGIGSDVASRVAAITDWIRKRISYVPGSSDVHDSAEDTLLTGEGTCRDFAHLGIALCRATGVPARFAAVYAPGLIPMEFHAVFEALQDGRWYVYDATGLAPRASLVRIVTGRDAADTAFSTINSGIASPDSIEVSATVGSHLPIDDRVKLIQLA
jgi:transglutaminase-like putative cysteine protease